MATSQEQVAALLKALLGRGLESKDAIPTIKALVQAKIFTLEDLNEGNMPPGIAEAIQRRILPRKRTPGGGEVSPAGGRGTKRAKTAARPKLSPPPPVIVRPAVTSQPESILINRSPVLTLWATVVAQALYPKATLTEALSLGGAVAGQLSKAKGTSLGIYQKGEEDGDGGGADRADDSLLEFHLLGFVIHGRQTPDGLRAVANDGREQDPHSTWRLLQKRFGDSLAFVMDRMERAAASVGRDRLGSSAYDYYAYVRPDIPQGTKGWGAHGRLHTERLSSFYATNED